MNAAHPPTPSATNARSGVRFALINCLDEARVDEFHEWYDTYIDDCLKPGHLTNARRYVNAGSTQTGEDAGFLAIYDTVTPDAGSAWPLTYEHINKLYPVYPEYIAVVVAGTYRVLDSTVHAPCGVAEQISVFMADGERSAFDDFVTHTLASEKYARAAAFELVEGFPETPPRHLLILEDHAPDADPAARANELAAPHGVMRVTASFRRHAPH